MGGTSTLSDLGFQPQTAQPQAPADAHPLADLGFKPAAATHPLADLGFKPATPAAAPTGAAPAPPSLTPPVYTFGQPKGLRAPGNINVNDRPIVPNPETGGSSTVWSTSFGNDQGEVLVPRITDGEDGKPPHILSDKRGPKGEPSETEAYYTKYGKHLGVFDTPDAATTYAQKLHEQQAGLGNQNGRTTARVAGAGPLGLPQPAAHPAVNLQPSLVGEVAGAAKEAVTHPIETLVGADLPSQTAEKQALLEQGAAGGSKIAQSALDVQKTEQTPLVHWTDTKTFQKMADPNSKNVVSRVLTGGSKALESLSSPDNLELLTTIPFAPEDAQQLLSAVFSAQMAQGAGTEGYAAIKAAHRGDYGEAAEKGATALINAAMAAASAKHAAGTKGATAVEEKPVLHGSNDVEELRASAERQAPKIGDAAATAAEGVPGAKLEAVRDSKDSDRISDKATRQGVDPNQIADIAAAKITVPDQAAADKVLANLHKEMPVQSVNGSLDEPGKNGVRQVQAVVNTGAEGEPVKHAEVLIQTPEMHEATDRTHDDYRKAQELRVAGRIEEANALEEKITREHDRAAQPEGGVNGKSPEPAAGSDRGVAPAAEKPELPTNPDIAGHDGRATEVLTPTRRMPSTYRLVEAADLRPSHHAQTFEENPEYPKGVQERDYKGSKEAQSRVIQQAQNYDPAYTVNTNPDAVNGPPVVTPDGTVLGGNSRAMSTQRLYAEGNGDKYRETLKRDAATYGLTPEHVDGMKQPVLVRQIERPGSVEDARRIGSELNKSMTGALGVSERAVSAGKNLKPETLRTVADMLQQDDSSLRELLSKRGPELLKMMQADGAITDRERPQFVDAASGGLSEEGKTFFERALMGSVIDDPRLMDAAPKSILSKLERSLGSIASFGSRPDEWNLLPALRQAVAEHSAIAKSGSTVDLHLNQQSMFGPERNPVVDALVRTLDEKPNAVRAKLDQFAKDADQNPHGQTKMFGGGEAFEAFNEAFGSKLTDKEYHDGSIQALRTDPAAATAKPASQETAKRNAGVPQRAGGEQTPGRSEGDGQPRAPKPPGEQRGQPEQGAGVASETRPSPAKVLAPKPAELKAPKPPSKPEAFKPGRQSTPIQVRDADGNWVHGTLDYYNDGVNGSPQRGRVTLANGFKMNNVADADMKLSGEEAPVTGITSGVGEQTKPSHGAVAYDLDKTLAHYDGYKGPTVIGKPIESEVASLKRDLAAGKDVWIFSARAADAEAVPAIKAWTKEHLGKELPVTNVKYPEFERFVDDRAEKPGYMEGKDGTQNDSNIDSKQPQQLGEGEVSRGTGAGSGDRGGDGKGPDVRTSDKPVPVDTSRGSRDSAGTASPASEAGGDVRREPGRGEDGESKANATRAAKRKEQLDAAANRTQRENAAQHKSEVVEVAGQKMLVLDPDGEGVWHRLFRKVKDVDGQNPLGAGESWRGVSLNKMQVNTALAYLHGATGDLDVSGAPDGGAKAGYERLAKMLKDARNEQGGATILRSDYRADTAREEAAHQWQREHNLDHSDAMKEVAARPEFTDAIDRLRDMGYEDATPRTLAMEAMAKAMAGDPDFKLTDEQREDLIRSFLTEAVEEKGAGILKNLPETDARLKDIISEVRRGYDDGEQYDQRDERGGGPPARGGDGQAGREAGEGDGAGAGTRRGQRADEDAERGVPKERTPQGELKAPRPPTGKKESTTGSDEPVFQRQKAPKPPPSMALPGMESADVERQQVSAEEEGKQLSEQMRTPLKDISKTAGKMERESPLFYGKGDQPLLFQLDKETNRENPWYLKSAKILDAKMKGPMPGDALVRMLENNGVKADELKWSGLEDLKGKAKVTPEQVAEHLKENAVKIKEVTKEETPAPKPGDANQTLSWAIAPRGGDATKYGSYQLPGGKNYREMLMTLPKAITPGNVIPRFTMAEELEWDQLRGKLRDLPERATPERDQINAAMDALHNQAARRTFEEEKQKGKSHQDFHSSHWDEPNVLAHVRMNDRTTPDGKKLLHLEEIQSDWHQKGRSKGYGPEPYTMREVPVSELPKLEQGVFKDVKTVHEAVGQDGRRLYVARTAEEAERRAQANRQGGVPDAPFKKDWHEMAFRRMVKEAADNGYDGLSWTPGEKQAERYDLSKQVDRISYARDKDGTYTVSVRKDHPRGHYEEMLNKRGLTPPQLAEVVGKEVAQKITDGVGHENGAPEGSGELKGLDLKVGGEGMKGFYDKIIPDYARKFGKQWGAKVDETSIDTYGDKYDYDSVAGGGFIVVNEKGAAIGARYETAEEAAKAVDKLNAQSAKVPYLDITPEMRKDVAEQGVPLFQKAKDEENPVARSVSDLVDDLKKLPKTDKGTALDRVANWSKDTVEDSLARSGKALGGVPSAFEKAFAWAKATTAALVHDYTHPIEQTDWKTQAGQMQLSQTETALKLQDLAKELKNLAPKPLDRIAMTHWMEAAGSDAKLKEWQAGAKARAMQAIGSDRARYLREAQQHYDTALKLTPEQKQLALRLRQHFNDTLDIAKKNGLLEFGYRNYVMHLYEKAEAANILHLVDTSELNPDPSFIKKRFHDTFYSAEGAGLTPKSKDIGYLLTAYDKSMNEAIASRNFMRNLLDAKAPDGRPIAAIKTRGGWVIAKDSEAPEVLNQRERPKTLEGYRDFDRPQLRNFLFKPTTADLEGFDPKLFEEDPEKLAFRGDLIIHPKYASRVEDMLTPSWFERGEGGAQKLGNAIVRGSALAKELMTAVAPFHMVQEGVHGMEHKVNPFKLPKIDLSDSTQRLLASHGLTLTNYDAEGLFGTKALKGLGEFVPGVNKAMDAMQSFSRWQFEDYIPRLKMRMATEAFERNVSRYPKLSEEQVAELTAKQSNAAFGNLNTTFDSVPRTKTFKTLLRLATFAPDFLESRMRFVGQAFTKYGGEQRAALIRGALAMYTVARVTNALLNDGDAKWDAEHAFSIVRNGRSYSLRTVQGDILHAVTDPRGFIYNRLNPLTTRPIVEFLSGRDQMGRQKTAVSQVKDLGKSALPFGIQKVIQTPDEDWLNSILTSTGLESKNYRTPTEEAVHKLYLAHIPDAPEDPEKQAESRKMRGFEDKIRSGHMTPTELWAKVEKNEVTPKEAGRTIQRAQKSRLQLEFQSLSLRDAIKVYGNANPLEQAELKPEFARKQALLAELPEADREKTAEKMQELLASK